MLLLFLPRYSPDFNPIELTFHLLKQWMKRFNDLCPSYGTDDYTTLFEAFLSLAVVEFGRTVDFEALFHRCHVRK